MAAGSPRDPEGEHPAHFWRSTVLQAHAARHCGPCCCFGYIGDVNLHPLSPFLAVRGWMLRHDDDGETELTRDPKTTLSLAGTQSQEPMSDASPRERHNVSVSQQTTKGHDRAQDFLDSDVSLEVPPPSPHTRNDQQYLPLCPGGWS